MTAVAVWTELPTAAALLADRLARGWRPTPSRMRGGLEVLGEACRVPRAQWLGPEDAG